MSKNFWCVRWNRVPSPQGLRRSVVAGVPAMILAALAVGLMGGPHVRAAQSRKADGAAMPGQTDTASQKFPAGNAERGKDHYVKDGCYQCHGYVGQGGNAGARLAPNPEPPEAIAAYIRKPSGQMPPYTSKLVPDQDVSDIYAYLKTMPAPVDISNIPTFKK